MVLLKKMNMILYSVATILLVLLLLPIDQWLGVQNANFKLAFFIIPFFGLATLPTAIYLKNIRQILFSVMLIVCYFILTSMVNALTGLFGFNLYSLFYR